MRTLAEVMAEHYTPKEREEIEREVQKLVATGQTHHILHSIPRSHGKRARFKARLRNART